MDLVSQSSLTCNSSTLPPYLPTHLYMLQEQEVGVDLVSQSSLTCNSSTLAPTPPICTCCRSRRRVWTWCPRAG